MGFRTLLVINDDRVKPGAAFGRHSHRDMEILSYVLEGALEHQDSSGGGGVIRPGEIQLMRARTLLTAALACAVVAAMGSDVAAQAPAGRGGGGGRGGRGDGIIPPLLMKTDAFEDGGIIPERYAGRGGGDRGAGARFYRCDLEYPLSGRSIPGPVRGRPQALCPPPDP